MSGVGPASAWQIVNDGVMGGVSDSRVRALPDTPPAGPPAGLPPCCSASGTSAGTSSLNDPSGSTGA